MGLMTAEDIATLDELANSLSKRADQLRAIDREFSGYEDPDGTIHPGVALLYQEALDNALDAIVSRYEDEGKRPPAEDIRAARARQRVERENSDLYHHYHAMKATIARLTRWLSINRDAVSAKQSVLKTERELTSHYGRQAA